MKSNFESLLGVKIPDMGEIGIIFFEECNLRCPMCPQDHNSIEGQSRDEILSKVDTIKNILLYDSVSSVITLNIMGGELFQDHLLEEYLPIYSEFIEKVNILSLRLNKKIIFRFVTNLVFTNHELVNKWLHKHNLDLTISYDSKGRFNTANLDTFKDNVEIFKDRINLISLVASRDSILTVMNRADNYYDYLYNNFDCHWEFLTPVPGVVAPTKKELYEFNKFLIDNYPNCLQLVPFVNKESINLIGAEVSQLAFHFKLIIPNNETTTCQNYEFYFPVKTFDTFIDKFIEEYDCLSCKYYSRCPLDPLMRDNWVDDTLTGCTYKKTFEYADKKYGTYN